MSDSDCHGAPSVSQAIHEFDQMDFVVRTFPRLFRGKVPQFSYVSKGWRQLMLRLLTDIDTLLDDEHAARFTVLRIKAKFGSLRFYWSMDREATTVIPPLMLGWRAQ